MFRITGSRGCGKTSCLLEKVKLILQDNPEVTIGFICACPDTIKQLYQISDERIVFATFKEFFEVKTDYIFIDEIEQFLKVYNVFGFSSTTHIDDYCLTNPEKIKEYW